MIKIDSMYFNLINKFKSMKVLTNKYIFLNNGNALLKSYMILKVL